MRNYAMLKRLYIVLLMITVTSFNSFAEPITNKLNSAISAAQSLAKNAPRLNIQSLKVKAVGSAKFSFLFWDIYQSILYTPSGRYLAGQSAEPVLFEIEYLTDISRDDLINRTIEQWQHLNISPSQYSPYIPKLKAIWPDIAAGDKLALLVSEQQATFYFNSAYIGAIAEPQFSEFFLAIWLSENTSQPALRSKLLGGNSYE